MQPQCASLFCLVLKLTAIALEQKAIGVLGFPPIRAGIGRGPGGGEGEGGFGCAAMRLCGLLLGLCAN